MTALVHSNAPHATSALYTAAALCALAAIGYVYLKNIMRGTQKNLPNGWLVRTASQASPIPVFVLLLLAPLDNDLIETLMQDRIVVAIAGLYGIVETLKDIRIIAKNRPESRNPYD